MRQQGLVSRRSSQAGKANLKPPLKEKFVFLYEDVFNERSPIQSARQEGFAGRQALQRFWDELFLLKASGSPSQFLAPDRTVYSALLCRHAELSYSSSRAKLLACFGGSQAKSLPRNICDFSSNSKKLLLRIPSSPQVNEAYLSQCMSSIPEEKLTGSLRHTINELFGACVR